jgi:hypothetical protein
MKRYFDDSETAKKAGKLSWINRKKGKTKKEIKKFFSKLASYKRKKYKPQIIKIIENRTKTGKLRGKTVELKCVTCGKIFKKNYGSSIKLKIGAFCSHQCKRYK